MCICGIEHLSSYVIDSLVAIGKLLLGAGISLLALTSFAFVLPTFAATGQNSAQFVAYTITATNSTTAYSAVVNETVSPSSTSGDSILTLQLTWRSTNYTISRLVNSSLAILPYLPSLGNQSFSYQGHNYTVSLSLVKTGTQSATVSGTTYTVTNYEFQVSGSALNGFSGSASGELSVLPSGLVYSASVNAKGYSIEVALLATNATLGSSSSSSAPIVIGGGVGAIAAGLGLFALYKKKNSGSAEGSAEQGEKPLYHVD